ncbi:MULTISPECIES: hypothetical protein [Micromonospora]|uniref:hypothetical protein n=1 Tax=Micromonospora TaxID=1873 RepID=UPI0015869DEF|nr:hypothetical protein [Micromonospora humi]
MAKLLHEARRDVAVREGRPDPGPFAEPRKPCSEASRKRAARELAGLLAEAEREVERRRAELRAAHEPAMLAEAAAAEAAALERRHRAVMHDDGPSELFGARPRPEPRQAAPVAPEGKGEGTETPRKRRPRRRPWFDVIDVT